MAEISATVCNPLLRTPLSLIIDDSCPVVNLAYFWMKERHAWKAKHRPDAPPDRWEGDPQRVDSLPRTIPAAFAAKWGEWCGEQGIRGKFSFIPYPAGVGRVDRGFPDFPARDLAEWLDVARDILAPNFDLTPEMLTHTHVVDLKTWGPTEEWEQVEWVNPPPERLAEYLTAAMQLLRDAGIEAGGATSPGAFAKKQEEAHSRAVLEASLQVNRNPRPFYFLWHKTGEMPDIPIWHADVEKARAVASITSCAGDWFGGWTGYDAGDADRFITKDLGGGRLPEVLAAELPCVLVGHWPGFYFGGEEVGFDVLKEVKKRLDAYDPDGTKTIWMKNSEIGHYWMARGLSEIRCAGSEVRVSTRFPAECFTLRVDGHVPRRVRAKGSDLTEVRSRRDFRSGTFLIEGDHAFAAFDLEAGDTAIESIAGR